MLLLCIASSGVACRSQTISQEDTKATTSRVRSIDDSSILAGWKRYSFDKPLAVSLILPTEPEQQTSTFHSGTVTKQTYISANDLGLYGLVYISDLPTVAKYWAASGNNLFYEIFIRDFAKKMESREKQKILIQDSMVKFMTERQVTVSNIEGWERSFSIGDFQGRAQLVRVGQAGLCMVAIWKQSAPPKEQDAFFNSVKIGEGK